MLVRKENKILRKESLLPDLRQYDSLWKDPTAYRIEVFCNDEPDIGDQFAPDVRTAIDYAQSYVDRVSRSRNVYTVVVSENKRGGKEIFMATSADSDLTEGVKADYYSKCSKGNLSLLKNKSMIESKRSRKLEAYHKTLSDEIIGKIERINDRLNDIDLEKLKSTLRRIEDLADSGNFDQATKMCRRLQSSASEAYDALNSIMYAAEDALSYFNPNVNVNWDAFGYKRK